MLFYVTFIKYYSRPTDIDRLDFLNDGVICEFLFKSYVYRWNNETVFYIYGFNRPMALDFDSCIIMLFYELTYT